MAAEAVSICPSMHMVFTCQLPVDHVGPHWHLNTLVGSPYAWTGDDRQNKENPA